MRKIFRKMAAAVCCLGSLTACAVIVGDPSQQALTFGGDGRIKAWDAAGRSVLDGRIDSGFGITDVATGKSAPVAGQVFADGDNVVLIGRAEELGLDFSAVFAPREDGAIDVICEVSDPTLADRALTVGINLALTPSEWHFGHSWAGRALNEACRPNGGCSQIDGFSGHDQSQLPLMAVYDGETGVGIAQSMRDIRFVSYRCHTSGEGVCVLNAAVDLGLAAETARFPGKAFFTLTIFTFEPRAGFRSAFAEYYRLFPESFQVNSGYEGAWALWISDLEAAARCGMGYNQCEYEYNKTPDGMKANDANGILTSQYSEPWGCWMPVPRGWNGEHLAAPQSGTSLPIRTSDYKALLEKDLGDETEADRYPGITRDFTARAIENTAIWRDPDGEWSFKVAGGFPWGARGQEGADALVILTDSNPEIPSPNRWDIQMNQVHTAEEIAASGDTRIGMIYLDSLVFGVGWDCYNFRRDLWQYSDVPLTWAMVNGKAVPAMHQALSNAMFLRKHREYCDENGYLTMGNSWQPVIQYSIGWLDVLGAGEHVDRNGLPGLADFATMRLLSGAKPVSTLDYAISFRDMSREAIDARMNYLLIYGVYSGTSDAWNKPDVIANFEPVMSRYAPLLKAVNTAGYEVETLVDVEAERPGEILLERWGYDPAEGLYLTCRNNGGAPAAVTLAFDEQLFTDPSGRPVEKVSELVDGTAVALDRADGRILLKLTVPAGRTQLLRLECAE